MNRFEYVTPKSTGEAVKLLEGQALAKAGGTDVIVLMKDRLIAPKRVVNLSGLDLGGIRIGKTAQIGALATLADVAAQEGIKADWTALAQAAGEAATPQIRNMATVGGNLCQRSRCWYFRSDQFPCRKKGGDLCFAMHGENRYHAILGYEACVAVHPSNLGPALVALEGTVHLQGGRRRKTVSAVEFFDTGGDATREHALAPGEIITHVEVSAGWKSVYLEIREKQSFDWPLVSIAMAKRGGALRAVLGGVAPAPFLVPANDLEAALKKARPLAHNAYKGKVVRALWKRARAAIGI